MIDFTFDPYKEWTEEDKKVYFEELKRMQQNTCELLGTALTFYINRIAEKYGNWKRYPRKVKKFLKKRNLWVFRKLSKVEEGDIQVSINEEYK